jgi:hypothetical protein
MLRNWGTGPFKIVVIGDAWQLVVDKVVVASLKVVARLLGLPGMGRPNKQLTIP